MNSITKNILLENGWEYKNYRTIGTDFYDHYFKSICDDKYHLSICPYSDNSKWNVQIDDCDYEPMGNCNIQTIKQFNDFMKVFNISYKLS